MRVCPIFPQYPYPHSGFIWYTVSTVGSNHLFVISIEQLICVYKSSELLLSTTFIEHHRTITTINYWSWLVIHTPLIINKIFITPMKTMYICR